MSSRELTKWEFTCDRCGYADSTPTGWERRRGLDFCPGCKVDLYRFLLNISTQHMPMGDNYRFADPAALESLKADLAAKGVRW